jgi:uncharacterized protein YecA (UPF0149 family)
MMFGFYESYYDIIQARKDMGYWPKPCRNRPDLMPKKDQGRNEKCSCGSGKKYKACCGKRCI